MSEETEFKTLGVKPLTHWRVKNLATERSLKVDEMVILLLDEFERSQSLARMKRLVIKVEKDNG